MQAVPEGWCHAINLKESQNNYFECFSESWVVELVAGVVAAPSDVVGRLITEDKEFSRFERMAKLKEVIMNTMAAPTVSLLRNVPGPRLPKTV